MGVWMLTSMAARADAPVPEATVIEAETPSAEPVFLVTEVTVQDGIGIEKDAARDALSTRFGRLREKIEVRSIGELKSSLDAAALAQMLGAASNNAAGGDADLQKLTDYVQVDRLVFGRIAEVGGVIEVQARIFNTREGSTEIALSRRLKTDAPRQLVLTVLDGIADGLAGYALDTYTDGAPSAAFSKLSQQKLGRRAPGRGTDGSDRGVDGASRWSMLGVTGGVLAGAGLGAGALAGVTFAADADDAGRDTAWIVLGAGAGAAVVGTALVVVDGLTE
jgi:hypothetical protein